MTQISADTGKRKIIHEQPRLPPFICVPLRNLRFKLRIFLTADFSDEDRAKLAFKTLES